MATEARGRGRTWIAAGLLGASAIGLAVWVAVRFATPTAIVDVESTAVAPQPSRAVTVAFDESTDGTEAVLAGRIVTRGGEPMAGVPVAIVFESDRFVPRWRGLTDPAGRFDFTAETAARLRSLEVDSTPSTARVVVPLDLFLEPGKRAVREFEVSGGGSVSGRVLDLDGNPVAGAEVFGWCTDPSPVRNGRPPFLSEQDGPPPDRRTTSAEDGSFRLQHMGTDFTIGGNAPGLTPAALTHGRCFDGDEKTGFALLMAPVVWLRGTVSRTGGQPAVGASVSVWETTSHWTTQEKIRETSGTHVRMYQLLADARGEFAVELPDRWSYRISVGPDQGASWAGEWRPGDGPVSVELSDGWTLRGNVLDAAGEPAREARVFYTQGLTRWEPCDSEGRFELTGIGELRQYSFEPALMVMADGCAATVVALGWDPSTWPELVAVKLDPEQAIAGRVVDAEGQPVPGAHLTLVGERVLKAKQFHMPIPTWESVGRFDRATSGPDGGFRFPGLYAGRFQLRAEDPSARASVARLDVTSGVMGLEVRLDDPAKCYAVFAGEVVDAVKGEPVPDATITVCQPMDETPGAWHHDVNRVGADGDFVTNGVDAGFLWVCAGAPGFVTDTVVERVFPVGRHEIGSIALHRAVTLHLKIVDPGDRPVLGGVRFTDSKARPVKIYLDKDLESSAMEASVGPGDCQLFGLPATKLDLHFTPFGEDREWTFPLDLRQDVEGPRVVRFPRSSPSD